MWSAPNCAHSACDLTPPAGPGRLLLSLLQRRLAGTAVDELNERTAKRGVWARRGADCTAARLTVDAKCRDMLKVLAMLVRRRRDGDDD